ncbi:serine/threonine-protein kinase [Streptomyces sp. CAU 1734]|uniref:serine/threonine-protein kinase n=1 Tax=Streptomyces sp. CAU 1734 TaxID=3140360 RepID=UPI0032618FCB
MGQVIQQRYELTGLLGRGGMAEVWSATDLQLNREVAVKLLRSAGRSTRRLEQRFEREAVLTARIGHPGVPAVHETGRHDGDTLFIAMERIHGLTLADRLKRSGPFPVPLAATVAAQTADVLAHAHRIGVVHRDLKPSNLMLTPNGLVKVLDFGIATALEPDPDEPPLTRTGEMPGTPGFISPEQAAGRAVTALSDMYAFGCVLYEILTGRAPFEAQPGAIPFHLVYRHMQEVPEPVSKHRAGLPPGLTDLITRMLAKEPADRPTAREVQEAAGEWIGPPAAPAVPSTGGAGSRTAPPGASRTGRPAAGPAENDAGRRAVELVLEARRLADAGDPSGALALLEEPLRGDRRPLDDPNLLPLRLARCELLFAAENLTVAYDGWFELGGALRRRRPATDRDVLVCRAGAARCLSGLGRTKEALHEFEGLLRVQSHVLGPADGAVFDTRYEIAVLTARGGHARTAHDQLVSLRSDQERVLPATDERHLRAGRLLTRLEGLLRSA